MTLLNTKIIQPIYRVETKHPLCEMRFFWSNYYDLRTYSQKLLLLK